jgi:peptide-methionine (S)-S-oxide reductase
VHVDKAFFGGGCFWAMEEAFPNLRGVEATEVGYMGGHALNPTHAEVRSGTSGHTEVVAISYDPAVISYEDLLKVFFNSHDPTQFNRQGPDVGEEFRSAIFCSSPEQHQAALRVRLVLNQMKRFRRPIMTEILSASAFYPAAEMHQHFLAKERARNHPWYPPVAEVLAEAKGTRLR